MWEAVRCWGEKVGSRSRRRITAAPPPFLLSPIASHWIKFLELQIFLLLENGSYFPRYFLNKQRKVSSVIKPFIPINVIKKAGNTHLGGWMSSLMRKRR